MPAIALRSASIGFDRPYHRPHFSPSIATKKASIGFDRPALPSPIPPMAEAPAKRALCGHPAGPPPPPTDAPFFSDLPAWCRLASQAENSVAVDADRLRRWPQSGKTTGGTPVAL